MRKSTEMSLRVDTGDSKIKSLQEPIEILAWSWGISTSKGYGDDENPRTSVQNISMTKFLGNNTPQLIKLLDDHVVLKSIILKCENEFSIINITFKNAYLTSVSMGGSGGEERLTENFTFGFESMNFQFTGKEDGKNIETDTANVVFKSRSK